MTRPAGPTVVLIGVSALLAAASGCADSRICAGVGVVSGIGVMFLHQGYDRLAGASYELCTRGECVKGALQEGDITKVNLPLPDDVDPSAAPAHFRVTREGATAPVVDAAVDVKLAFQSDGCGGGAYNGGLAFTRETGLTTKIPANVSAAWLAHIRSLDTS